MKFIHAADLHLGAPFSDLTSLPKRFLATVLAAQATALTRLVDDALAEDVDWVAFVGDVFDQARPDIHELLVFIDQMQRLADADIPVYITRGNHDFAWLSQVDTNLPANVTVFPADVTTKLLTTRQNERVAITGFSYDQAHLEQGPAVTFPQRPEQVDWAVGLYHGEQGPTGVYAPFELHQLLMKHYDYWALGHIHQRTTLHQAPFIGYVGDMQATKSNEVTDKGYYLVSTDGATLKPYFTSIAPVAFQVLTIQADSEQVLFNKLRAAASSDYDLTLLTVHVETTTSTLAQKIVLHQLDANANWPADTTTWVIRLDLMSDAKKVSLPVVPADYWEQTAAKVFTAETLQDLGLSLIQDADLLDTILSPAYLATLKGQVEEQIGLTEKEGLDAN